MSTLKTINIIHPSGSTNNIVNDASGNSTIGNNLYVTGNVGVGNVSPAYKVDISGNLRATGGTISSNFLISTIAGTCGIQNDTSVEMYGASSSQLMLFRVNGNNERMRIDASGNVLVGSTAQIQSEKLGVTSGTANATQYQTISTKGGSTLFVNQQQTTSVSTSAVTILNGPQYMNFCLVYGTDGTNRFADVVLMSVGTGTVNVISSLTASGSPGARTYTQASSSLRLTMASGTYTVQVTCLAMGAS